MKVVIQRVDKASVIIDSELMSGISNGLLIFLGVEDLDTIEDIKWLTVKISDLRIFDDEKGLMNLSLKDVGGEAMVVSQFTLHASTKKGNRPSFIRAAKPNIALPLYENFVNQLEFELGRKIKTGKFGADMKISLINNGPVTIIIDSKNKN